MSALSVVRVIIYVPCSTEEHARSGCRYQNSAAIASHAELQGWAIVAIIIEDGERASTLNAEIQPDPRTSKVLSRHRSTAFSSIA